MSKFFCDSCCELFGRADELGLTTIKIPYSVNGEIVEEQVGQGFDADKFYANMQDGAATSTSALNPQEYIELFEPVLQAGQDILYLGFSHDMSGTFDKMKIAIDELAPKYPNNKITTVDTRQMSMGCGILVYYAALQHKQGMSDSDIVQFVDTMSKKIKTYVTVEDLKYLKRGGRISGLTAFVGGILNIKPILSMVDGKLIKIDKVKGRKASMKALQSYLETDNVDTAYPIVLINAVCTDDSDLMVQDIKAKYPEVEIWTQQIGPVVGSHSGPGTLSLFFVAK